MKKLASFLLMVLLIILLTGCGVDKKAVTGLTNDSVNKVASKIEDTKSPDASLNSENEIELSDNTKPEVEPTKPDIPKTTDKAQSQEYISNTTSVSTPNTNTNTDFSTQTPVNQVPIPIKPEDTAKEAVTIAINCQTAVAKGLDKQEKFKDVVPANGIILPSTRVEFKDGETVFDVLKRVTRENKIQMQYEGSKGTPYIKGINNLYEFDSGPLSGWMYCVNKLYANYGCNETKLKNGDVIEWNYSCDMGKDLGQK